MLGRMLAAALAAGLISGLAISAVQHVTTTPLILAAEVYEEGGGVPAAAPHGAHTDEPAAWTPADGPERTLHTAAANMIAGVGFALLLVAAFAVHGGAIDGRRGVLWGTAGFAAFALNPSLGLPPELPGTVAVDLTIRQVWWSFAVASTAIGLGLVVFRRRAVPVGFGALAIALPHLVGAPHPGEVGGPVPPELAARFAAASLAVAALFWVLLGAASGALYRRLVADAGAASRAAAMPRRRIGGRTG